MLDKTVLPAMSVALLKGLALESVECVGRIV